MLSLLTGKAYGKNSEVAQLTQHPPPPPRMLSQHCGQVEQL